MIMKHGLFVITGTSRGIGEAMARRFLAEGHMVLGISRSQPTKINTPDYSHLTLDLSDTAQLGQVRDSLIDIKTNHTFNFVCLVNNASATEPIGPIENGSLQDIEAHVRIGLIAPMVLTSLFIREFAAATIDKKIVFISSGAAFSPLRDESIYCSVKAGAYMFGRCVGLEQEDKQHGFQVISIGPGMVDTSMQKAIRSKSSDEFAMADYFKQAHEDGKLQDPDIVAGKILTILASSYDPGQYVSVSEV